MHRRTRILVAAGVVAAGVAVARAAHIAPADSRDVAGGQAVATAPASRPAPDRPAMLRVDAPAYEFGRIWDTAIVTHTFEMVNTGDRPVKILDVRPTCGCTTADAWSREIAPGATWQLPVTFVAAGRPGKAVKAIVVVTDDPGAPEVTFLFEGEVDARFEMISNVPLGTLQQDSVIRKTVRIDTNGDEPVTLRNPTADLAGLKLGLREIEPGRRYELDIETVPPLRPGSLRGKITVQTGLKGESDPTISVFGYVQPRIMLQPAILMISQSPGKAIRRRLVLRTAGDVLVRIKEVKATNPDIGLEVKPEREGRQYSIWVTIPPDVQLAAGGEQVTVTTDDAEIPTLVADLRSHLPGRPHSPVMGAAAPPSAAPVSPATQPGGRVPSDRPVPPTTRPR